jgi:hypothetical protein
MKMYILEGRSNPVTPFQVGKWIALPRFARNHFVPRKDGYDLLFSL